MNLASKYRPKTFDDVVEQGMMINIVKSMCESNQLQNRNFLFIGPAGCGKAQPLDSKVLTPTGFITMGEVHVGTEVITRTGEVAKVIGVFPQGHRPVYQIKLADGEMIRVADNHLNLVCIDEVESVVTTDCLISCFSGGHTLTIPKAQLADYIGLVPDYPEYRDIVDIVYEGKAECQCIYVDHPDHTYISDGFIPTHNTTTARIIANHLNQNQGTPIEIDAASHSGADDMRLIVQQASQYPVGMKYKVFIIDECFSGDSLVLTPSGQIKIKDIAVGDTVYNMQGVAKVTRLFKNRVKPSNLVSVRLGDNQIITTKDHLFFTDCGWVPAKELCEGDILYDYSTVCTMWKDVRSSISQRFQEVMQQGMSEDLDRFSESIEAFDRISKNVSNMWQRLLHSSKCECNNLFYKLFSYLEKAESQYGKTIGTTLKTLVYIYLSSMWEAEGSSEFIYSEVLQQHLPREMEQAAPETFTFSDEGMRMVQDFIYCALFQQIPENMLSRMSNCSDCIQASWEALSRIFNSNDVEQPNESSRSCSEDNSYKVQEWNTTYWACLAWWERNLHSTSTNVERSSRSRVDIRVSCKDTCAPKEPRTLSYELQSRPRLSKISDRDRGGWCRPSIEIATLVGCQEDQLSRELRVEGVEIYQPGDNDELFQGSFTDTELHQEYVTLYDLEIEGHPSYFINNILVHNCHSISSTGWQVLLKCLEEQPAKTVFLLCTTNPEKIPATILSRVQTFQLSKISLQGIFNRLKYVIEAEKSEGKTITYQEDALTLVAKLANGGLRDSLTLLDKCLAYSLDITTENVIQALDLPNYDTYFALLNGLVKKDNKTITDIVNSVYNSGTNFVKWFESFHSFIANIIKYIYIKDISATMIPSTYLSKIENYNEQHASLCLKLSNVLLNLNKDLKTTQYLEETALTYLLSPVAKKGG